MLRPHTERAAFIPARPGREIQTPGRARSADGNRVKTRTFEPHRNMREGLRNDPGEGLGASREAEQVRQGWRRGSSQTLNFKDLGVGRTRGQCILRYPVAPPPAGHSRRPEAGSQAKPAPVPAPVPAVAFAISSVPVSQRRPGRHSLRRFGLVIAKLVSCLLF